MISYVSNRIFLIKDGDENDSGKNLGGKDDEENSDDGLKPMILKRIPIGFCASIKLSLQRLCLTAGLNKCCAPCHSRRDKLSHLADKLAKDELKIVRWLQFKRCMNLAM